MQTKNNTGTALGLLLVAASALGLGGCDRNQGPAEEAGEAIDEAVEEARDAAEDAAEEIEDRLEN